MNPAELKNKMKSLWRDTFHDSDAYINLVFDNYFNPDLLEYEEMNGDVVAGLLGVPYSFGNSDRQVRGLYLCGLATKPQYRSRGIMTRMLARINEKALKAGFAFTFLIPADAGLRKYYKDRDYVNAFYRIVDNYTSLHDFDREYDSILLEQKEKVSTLKRKYYELLQTGKISIDSRDDDTMLQVGKLIESKEKGQLDLRIIHSEKDIAALMEEALVSKGMIYYVKSQSGVVTGAAFVDPRDKSEIDITRIFYNDQGSKYKLLDKIKRDNPDSALQLFISSVEMDRKALWMRTYGSYLPDAPQAGAISMTERVYSLAAHAGVYGMARILNIHEILKFQAEGRKELKYSILMKGDDPYVVELIKVRDGKVDVKNLTYDQLDDWQAVNVMSQRQIGEILFRRHDTDNVITDALGMPSVCASASLLLD